MLEEFTIFLFLSELLKQRVVGQDEAVEAVSNAVSLKSCECPQYICWGIKTFFFPFFCTSFPLLIFIPTKHFPLSYLICLCTSGPSQSLRLVALQSAYRLIYVHGPYWWVYLSDHWVFVVLFCLYWMFDLKHAMALNTWQWHWRINNYSYFQVWAKRSFAKPSPTLCLTPIRQWFGRWVKREFGLVLHHPLRLPF